MRIYSSENSQSGEINSLKSKKKKKMSSPQQERIIESLLSKFDTSKYKPSIDRWLLDEEIDFIFRVIISCYDELHTIIKKYDANILDGMEVQLEGTREQVAYIISPSQLDSTLFRAYRGDFFSKETCENEGKTHDEAIIIDEDDMIVSDTNNSTSSIKSDNNNNNNNRSKRIIRNLKDKPDMRELRSFKKRMFLKEPDNKIFNMNDLILSLDMATINSMIPVEKIDYLIIPISGPYTTGERFRDLQRYNNNHWSLLVYSRKNNKIFHYDTYNGHNNRKAREVIRTLIAFHIIDLNPDFFEPGWIPMQASGWECGYNVIIYGLVIFCKRPLRPISIDDTTKRLSNIIDITKNNVLITILKEILVTYLKKKKLYFH